MEQAQVDLIEGLLLGGDLSTGFLFVALALTPAVCEELLFRGYLQRQVERSWGAMASIVAVGILFGLYHLRPSQAVPLALLGVYMGYAVWATGSLWAGVLVHLLNNGFQVIATEAFRRDPSLDPAVLEGADFPWYFGLTGLVAAVGVGWLLWRRRQSVVGAAPDAQPVPLPSPSPPASP
jgi:membrane protease YdiL (CAAX protease family)